MRYVVLASLLASMAGGIFLLLATTQSADAAGPCGTSHDAMDAEEFEFLVMFQAWRDANLDNSSQLTPSGPLNAAAAWYAEWQVHNGSPGGHFDNFNRDYFNRARDCGWPLTAAQAGMGEGGALATTAVQAAALVPHSSVGPFEAPDHPWYPPLKCIGIGRATANGDTFWVVLIAQFPANQECPAAQTSPQTGSPTGSPTATTSPTPTPSPTPSPTPPTWNSWLPGLAKTD